MASMTTPLRQQQGDTRSRLLEAAGEVFSEKGFASATVRDICQRAAVNLAAVKYYFGDKLALYVETVRFAQAIGHGDTPLPEWAPDMPPEEKLRRFVEFMLLSPPEDRGPAWARQLMIREMAEPSAACLPLVEAFVRPRSALLKEILVELLPPDVDDVTAYLTAFSIVGQCLFHRVHRVVARVSAGPEVCDDMTTERVAQHITQFTLAALGRAG